MAKIDNRPLKAYVRFDGTGRIVPSSLILRRKKPKVGKWMEIPAYQCCNNTPTLLTTAIPGSFPLTYVSVRIFCDESTASTAYTSLTAENMDELIQLLNTNNETRVYGTYTAIDETTVQLSVPTTVKNNLCPGGTLSFIIFED